MDFAGGASHDDDDDIEDGDDDDVEDGDYDNYDYNDRPTVIYTVTLRYFKNMGRSKKLWWNLNYSCKQNLVEKLVAKTENSPFSWFSFPP